MLAIFFWRFVPKAWTLLHSYPLSYGLIAKTSKNGHLAKQDCDAESFEIHLFQFSQMNVRRNGFGEAVFEGASREIVTQWVLNDRILKGSL